MITLILTLMIAGFLLYLVNTYWPMEPLFKTIINAVVVICVLLWLVDYFEVASVLPRHHYHWRR